MKKLMIVDDDEIVQYYLQSILKKSFPDVSVFSFTNGKAALEYLMNNNCENLLPDFIILDINMPVMSGWDFLGSLNSYLLDLKKVPRIIMSSSSSSHFDLVRAVSSPLVYQFITKPVTSDHLSSLL